MPEGLGCRAGSKADQFNKKRLADGGKGATQTAYEIVRLDDGTTYITHQTLFFKMQTATLSRKVFALRSLS